MPSNAAPPTQDPFQRNPSGMGLSMVEIEPPRTKKKKAVAQFLHIEKNTDERSTAQKMKDRLAGEAEGGGSQLNPLLRKFDSTKMMNFFENRNFQKTDFFDQGGMRREPHATRMGPDERGGYENRANLVRKSSERRKSKKPKNRNFSKVDHLSFSRSNKKQRSEVNHAPESGQEVRKRPEANFGVRLISQNSHQKSPKLSHQGYKKYQRPHHKGKKVQIDGRIDQNWQKNENINHSNFQDFGSKMDQFQPSSTQIHQNYQAQVFRHTNNDSRPSQSYRELVMVNQQNPHLWAPDTLYDSFSGHMGHNHTRHTQPGGPDASKNRKFPETSQKTNFEKNGQNHQNLQYYSSSLQYCINYGPRDVRGSEFEQKSAQKSIQQILFKNSENKANLANLEHQSQRMVYASEGRGENVQNRVISTPNKQNRKNPILATFGTSKSKKSKKSNRSIHREARRNQGAAQNRLEASEKPKTVVLTQTNFSANKKNLRPYKGAKVPQQAQNHHVLVVTESFEDEISNFGLRFHYFKKLQIEFRNGLTMARTAQRVKDLKNYLYLPQNSQKLNFRKSSKKSKKFISRPKSDHSRGYQSTASLPEPPLFTQSENLPKNDSFAQTQFPTNFSSLQAPARPKTEILVSEGYAVIQQDSPYSPHQFYSQVDEKSQKNPKTQNQAETVTSWTNEAPQTAPDNLDNSSASVVNNSSCMTGSYHNEQLSEPENEKTGFGNVFGRVESCSESRVVSGRYNQVSVTETDLRSPKICQKVPKQHSMDFGLSDQILRVREAAGRQNDAYNASNELNEGLYEASEARNGLKILSDFNNKNHQKTQKNATATHTEPSQTQTHHQMLKKVHKNHPEEFQSFKNLKKIPQFNSPSSAKEMASPKELDALQHLQHKAGLTQHVKNLDLKETKFDPGMKSRPKRKPQACVAMARNGAGGSGSYHQKAIEFFKENQNLVNTVNIKRDGGLGGGKESGVVGIEAESWEIEPRGALEERPKRYEDFGVFYEETGFLGGGGDVYGSGLDQDGQEFEVDEMR